MIPRKMTGSISLIREEQLNNKLKDIAEIISAYNLANTLAEDEKEKEVVYSTINQQIDKKNVQVILGENFRVSLVGESIEIVFSQDRLTMDQINNFEEYLNKMKYEYDIKYSSDFGGQKMKAHIVVGNEVSEEDILNMFLTFKIK